MSPMNDAPRTGLARADQHRRGLALGAAAYGLWGLFPIYFKALSSVGAVEILAQRIAWAFVFLLLVLYFQQQGGELLLALRSRRSLGILALSAAAIAVNWLVYIWAVVTGRILDASLGYFINPLVNVLLGVLAFKERLEAPTKVAMALAGTGVAWMTFQAGQLPWISLVLATSFGSYGMLRKMTPVGAVAGICVETLLLFPLAFGYLIWSYQADTLAFFAGAPTRDVLLLLSGPLTAIPLLLFAAAARRLPLSTLGFLQYLSPSIQFLIAVFVYGEPFASARAVAFVLIWTGLAIFMAHSLRRGAPVTATAPD
jgi:chloramphenicol-sensitive protein RarD